MRRVKKLMSNSSNVQPALKRLASDCIAAMSLTDTQRESLRRFISCVESSEYAKTRHSCLCGAIDDIVVACKDRYGIPLRTVLCKGCGLMRSDPYLSPDALVKFYRNDYRSIYEYAASPDSRYLARMITNGERIYQFFRDHNVAIPKHVFEVGCGIGGNLVPFLLQDHTVAGCDYGTDYLEIGRKIGLDLRHGDLETLGHRVPLSLIILSHVLEHFRDPISELSCLRKILPEDSLVYVGLPGIYSIRQTYGDPLLFLQNAHAYHFCLQTLDYAMSLVGFERVYGDERVQAIYRLNLSLQPMSPDPELYRRVLGYLKRIDRLRWFPHSLFWFQQSMKLARKLMGSRFYEWVKRVTR